MIRTRPARAAALALVLALPLGLVACGGADDSAEVVSEGSSTTATTEGSDESTTTTEGTDDPTTTTTQGSDGSTTTTEGGGEVSGDLSAALLTADDLPPGHAQDGEDDTSDTTMSEDDPLCAGSSATFPTPVEQIERSFQTEDYSSLVGSFAARFDGEDAEDGLAFYRSELERCGGTAEDELAYEFRELPGIGDEALEISLFDAADPSAGAALIYFARVDDVLVGVSVFAEETSGVDGESLIALSAGRL